MINLVMNDADRILTIEMSGMISEADIDRAIETLEARYPGVSVHLRGGDRGPFSVLADWQDLDGWQTGAKTLGTVTLRTIGDAARRIAVLADEKFADELPRLADVAPRAEVRLFPTGQRDEAIAWLRGH